MTTNAAIYPGYRLPAEVINHVIWLYHVFSLSLRDVELILAHRGILVTHESIRCWSRTFDPEFARKLRRSRPKQGDTWCLDEVYLRINGELNYLWRVVEQNGVVLDILVQHRSSRYLNNRTENSHRSTRPRRLMTADQYRRAPAETFRIRQQETCVQVAG